MGSSVNEILINRSLARRCPDLNREILSETWSQAKRSTGLCHSGSFVIYQYADVATRGLSLCGCHGGNLFKRPVNAF